MATAPATIEQYFGRTPQPARIESDESIRSWNSWESWLTLSLVLLVQLPVVGSLQTANWVDEMPSLMASAGAGLATAWVLGHTRLRGLVSSLIGAAVGAVTVVGLVLHTMVLTDPTASGARDRWAEFRLRLLEWGRALVDEGISTDPLPFVVLLVATVYLVGFVSTWAVVRWRNPWVALVPGGFVLLTNISYLPGQPSFSFIIFLLGAILLVTRLTFLQSLLRWRRGGVHPHEGMSIEVLLVGAAIAVALIAAAWTIPTANNWGPVSDAWGRALAPVQDRVDRLGQLFIGVGSKKPIPVHAMGGILPLQGKVVLDQDVLFEVVAPEEMNLRGAVYDEYTGAGWRVSSAAAIPLVGTTVEAAELGTPSSRAAIRDAVRVDVTVLEESAPTDVMLAAGDPIASDRNADLVVDRAGGPLQLRPSERIREGDTYSTVGTRSIAAVDTLSAAGTTYPSGIVPRYLQLPDNLPPEVQSLALSIAGDAENPYEAARRIEEYLRENYTFTFDIDPPPPGRDAVGHFLFESRRGYFDLFSSSMAVMLRSVGVPSRVAVGFALDEADFDGTAKAYRVTEERAWAWPEVYFPGLGWVEFNPTPARDLLSRPGDDSAARAAADADATRFDDGFEDELFADLGEVMDAGEFQPAQLNEADDAVTRILARIIGWTLVASTVALVVIIGVRLLWERAFRGLEPAEKRWAKMQWTAAVAGLRPDDDRTPTEAARDLVSRVGEPDSLLALARAYTRVRYGGPAAGAETEDEAEALDAHYRRVRRALTGHVAYRVTHLGRTKGGSLSRRYAPTRLAG